MNTKMRILLAASLFVALLVAAMGAPAWAEKLSVGTALLSPGGPRADPPAAVRPAGTVLTTAALIPITGGPVTVGSCATVWVKFPPVGVNYTASVVPESELPLVLPGKLVTCAIKIEAFTSPNLGSETLVCWPLLPAQSGFAYYFDGTKWVRTALQTSDGQVCANVVPGTAPNPAFAAVFDK